MTSSAKFSILLLPLAVALLLLAATGVGLLTAGLTLFFRDLLQLLDVMFTALSAICSRQSRNNGGALTLHP